MSVEIIEQIDLMLADKIAAWLKDNLPEGYEITAAPRLGAVGIIYSLGDDLKIANFTLMKAPRIYFGTIYTETLCLSEMYKFTAGATETNWIFTLYGRRNLDAAEALANRLAAAFNVSIKIILLAEEQKKYKEVCDWQI